MARRRIRLATLLLLAVLAACAAALPAVPGAAPAVAAEPTPVGATLVLFHGDGCPHCAAEREWLGGLRQRHPALVVEEHEVWFDDANRALLEATAAEMGFEPTGVPVTIVGDHVWIGFSEAIGGEIEAAVMAALAPPSAGPSVPGAPTTAPSPAAEVVDVPLVGAVDVASSSLVAATLAIGFVDGVNPCSLWVLSVLLAIVLHTGSRGRVALVGGTFLAVTAGMYGLYMVGFYSALDYVGGLGWIRVAVAAVALAFGVLQIADVVAPGKLPSLSISPDRRPALFRRMRSVAGSDRGVVATVAGTVVLAIGVSLLETPCTAGLPLLWTSLLADQGVGGVQAVALFALYLAVFLLDELLVFGAAVWTLRAARVQERHGRALKLVSGSVLVSLALSMLVAPEALTTLTGTLAVFGSAAVLAVVLWSFTRSRSPTGGGRAVHQHPS